MEPDVRAPRVNCPSCGAKNPATSSTCLACSKGLLVYIGPARALPRRVGLASLMTLVALTAVGLALFRAVPIAGIVVFVIGLPALIRVVAASAQRAEDGRELSAREKVELAITSVGLMIVVLLSFWVTALAVAALSFVLAIAVGPAGLAVAGTLAGLAGFYVAARVLGRYWIYDGE